MSLAYLSLGSNLNDPEIQLQKAVKQLQDEAGIGVIAVSEAYHNKAYGYAEQADFVNLAMIIEVDIAPHALLSQLKSHEEKLGRIPTFKWGPRLIDIDILFYDDLVLTDETLCIPHPDLHKRDFVLYPLNQIAAELIHPVLKKSINQLYNELILSGGKQ